MKFENLQRNCLFTGWKFKKSMDVEDIMKCLIIKFHEF